MASINKIMLLGRLGQNPDLKHTQSGKDVCNFSVATSEIWKDQSGMKQERTTWHRVIVWGKMASICHQYLAKGSQVFIEGSYQSKEWQDKQGAKRISYEVNATNIQFLGSKPKSEPAVVDDSQESGLIASGEFTEEDIPF